MLWLFEGLHATPESWNDRQTFSVLHPLGEEGVRMYEVAEVLAEKNRTARRLHRNGQSGVFGALPGGDQPASDVISGQPAGWEPSARTLLDDSRADYIS